MEMQDLVHPDARENQVATGFGFTEGPVWHPDGYLLFSDIPMSTRYRWTPASGITAMVRPSNKGNGMTFDPWGRLLVCEHDTSSVVRVTVDSGGAEQSREVLASHYTGLELNSPNDIAVRTDGSVYFTDPTYGRMEGIGIVRDQELDFQGVFRIAPDGELHCVAAAGYIQPNGICFSPGEDVLYVNDTIRCAVYRYDVHPDGSLSGEALLLDGIGEPVEGINDFPSPDGMKCDELGNVWTTGPGGIWAISPGGQHIGTIGVEELPANFCWGGDDLRTMFITCTTSLTRIPVLVGPAGWPSSRYRARAGQVGAAPGSAQS
jgi:gluconolactonase